MKINFNDISIVSATPEDIKIILGLQDLAGPLFHAEPKEKILSTLNNPHFFGILVKYRDKYIGLAFVFIGECKEYAEMYATINITKTTAIFDALIVHPDYRSMGLSKYLIKEVEKIILSNNCNEVYATVNFDNIISRNNLTKHGFIVDDYIEDKYGKRYIMKKSITK